MKEIDGWVALLANWLSIVSVLASVYAAVTIARVRRDILRRATLPGIVAALETSVRAMTDLLGSLDDNWRPIELELARCEANLRAVVNAKLSAERRARALLRDIDVLRRPRRRSAREADSARLDQAWKVYASLSGLVEELKQIALWHRIGG